MKHVFLQSLFSTLFIIVASHTIAQDGTLDLSFNSTGKVLTTAGPFDASGYSVAVKENKLNPTNYNDRRIYVAGQSLNGASNYDFVVSCYKDDGSLDQNFGGTGVVVTDFSTNDDKAKAIVIQDDGKIVVGGLSSDMSTSHFALARYKVNGALDSTFGTYGKIITNVPSQYSNILCLALQSDGKIVAGGFTDNGNNLDFALARFDVSGNLDLNFDTDGFVTTAVGNGSDIATSILIQNDGKIVVGGYSIKNNNYDFTIVRYEANGSLDNSFDSDGIVTTAIYGTANEYAYSLTSNALGKYILAGNSDNTYYDVVLAQYNNNGSLDNSFGTNGVVHTDFGSLTDYAAAADVLVQNDGKLVVGGYHNVGVAMNYALVRYKVSGAVDSTFGTNGIVSTDFNGGDDEGLSIALQADGKILLAGGSHDGTMKHIALARYENAISSSLKVNQTIFASIYPNPFSTSATISTEITLHNASVELFNALGEKVYFETGISGNTFQVQSGTLTKGIYMLKVVDENGVQISAKMILD